MSLACLNLPDVTALLTDMSRLIGVPLHLQDRHGQPLISTGDTAPPPRHAPRDPGIGVRFTHASRPHPNRTERETGGSPQLRPSDLTSCTAPITVDTLPVAHLTAGPFRIAHTAPTGEGKAGGEGKAWHDSDQARTLTPDEKGTLEHLIQSLANQIGSQLQSERQAREAAAHTEALLADRSAGVRDLQNRLAGIAQQVPGVIYQFRLYPDGRTCFPYASAGMSQIYGVGPASLQIDASPAFARHHPDDAETVWASILESAASGTVWHQQYRCLHPTKGLIWLEGRATPDRLADGSVIWHGMIVDVTDRIETERCLQETRDRYRVVTEALGDGTWEFDLRTGSATVDSRFHDMLGYDPRDYVVTVQSWLSMIHPDDSQPMRQTLRSQWMVGDETCIEYRHRTARGDWLWIEARGFVLERDCGWPVLIIGTNRAVSDRKAMQAALENSEARFRTLFEYAPMAYLALDPAGRVVDLNTPLCHMLDRTRSQLLGQVFGAFLTPQTRAEGMRALTRLQSERHPTTDLSLQKPDGSVLTVQMVSQPQATENGTLLRTHCVLHDISAHARLESRLARSNADLTQFAYAVSHDLREPLRMVSGFLGLIDHRMSTDADPDLGEFLAFAIDGAKRLDRMILDLLEYSRIGRDGEEAAPIGLSEVVGEALTNLKAAITERGAIITVDEGLPTISGRHPDLVRLFQNTIGNAIKFVPNDRSPRIRVLCREDNATLWRITIVDNGNGIPEPMRDRVFGVFERLVREDQVSGSGIGLALSRKIVERHGGTIWFGDTVGIGAPAPAQDGRAVGAVLHITLPKQSATAAASPAPNLDRITLLEILNTHQMRIAARLRNLSDTIKNRDADRPTILGELDFLLGEVERYRVFVHANAAIIFGLGLSRHDQDPAAAADSLMFAVHQLHRILQEQDPSTSEGQTVIGRTISTLMNHLRQSHIWLQQRRRDRIPDRHASGA